MFQLIIAVVGVLLAALIAVMALWLGGSAFTTSGEKATFAQYLNEGSQIEAGLKMYNADNGHAPSGEDDDEILELLKTEEYLNTVPAGEWRIVNDAIYRELTDVAQCRRLNIFMGKDVDLADQGCPPCSGEGSAGFAGWPGCRAAELGETTP